MKHLIVGVVIVGALVLGFWAGHEWQELGGYTHREWRSTRYVEGQLTSPLLSCIDDPSEVSIGARATMEKEVNAYVAQAYKQKLITNAAVYFRDLNNGPWFGIKERELFTPGSLLKLPIALSLYWRAEREEGIFDTTLTYDGVLPPEFASLGQGDEEVLTPGTYSVRDLVSYMLKDSSNAAASLLVRFQGDAHLQGVFEDLGIEAPQSDTYTLDVKTFGSFFRILYNASYIDQPASEELLKTMTQSSFINGIVKGVPKGTVVSHKFGTRVQGGVRQLHDCGIVYAPHAPYILCIMSQGASSSALEQFIVGVSAQVYAGVAK